MQLRPYQIELENKIYDSWNRGNRVVLATSPTGSGKTVLFSNVLSREPGATAAIAHRRELVTQMSLTLARNGVRHRVIGPKQLCKDVVQIHMAELGTSYYDPRAACGVVGIDSLPGLNSLDPWLSQVRLWVGDEGHHFLKDNKWGRGVEMFPNARGLLVTATAFRADGRGLGSHADGLADDLVMGPTMRELINMGYLTDYRILAPRTEDLDFRDVTVTASGDLSPQKNRAAMHRSSKIVGDVVKHYLKFARGKLGVTFAVDVESAKELAVAYREAGVPAEVVSAKTPDVLRAHILRRFKNREIMQLVNVDLFGEGFDLPSIEVVSMVRKTESTGLFDQQFGRVLRPMEGKEYGLVIDHVGNVERHLPPDCPRVHTLDARDKRSRSKAEGIPVTTCTNVECLAVYERTRRACPFCGTTPEPSSRGAPEFVDGDLEWLDPAALAKLRGEIEQADAIPAPPSHLSELAAAGYRNRQVERQHAQRELRAAMDLWCGWRKHLGDEDSEIQRRFYHTYGIDLLTAQTLRRRDTEALHARIAADLDELNVVPLKANAGE